MLSVEEWKQVKCITIIPYYQLYSDEGKAFTEEGVYAGYTARVNSEMVFLYDCAITIEITPELFKDGY